MAPGPPRTPQPAGSRSEFDGSSWLVQAVKFGLVGVLNTAVDFCVYYLLTRWAGLGELRVAAKGVSYGVGILNSFFWNRSWTFRSRAGVRTALPPFALANVIGLAINTAAMHVCLNILRLPELLALVLATSCALAWNFALSKFVIFRARPDVPGDGS